MNTDGVGLRMCPVCGSLAIDKSIFGLNDHCFRRHGGCGATLPSLAISAPGLQRGFALSPYTTMGGVRSPFGEAIHRLKYWSYISIEEKQEIVNWIVRQVKHVKILDALVPSRTHVTVIPIPATNSRDYQPVYEIAKGISEGNYDYLAAISKNTQLQSKNMQRGQQYQIGDFEVIHSIPHQPVLLIDDTYGEGASLQGCIDALKSAGVKEIYFLSICKNTRGGIKGENQGLPNPFVNFS